MKTTPVYHRLDFKLILGLIVSLLVVGFPFFSFFLNFQKQQFIDGLKMSTVNLSQLVVSTLEASMLSGETHSLQEEVNRLTQEAGVERIMILNKKGTLKMSSDPKITKGVPNNKADPICFVCHQYSPVKRKNTVIVRGESGDQVFRSMTLIHNRPACYECHSPQDVVNGVLVMDLSMEEIQTQLASNRVKLYGLAFAMIVVTSVVLGLLVNRLVLRRVKKFTETTHHISEGHLDEVISFKGNDEISDLAKSFNHMTAHLKETLQQVEKHREYLEHVINGIDDEIVVVDHNYEIVAANDAYLGRCQDSRENIIGSHCYSVAHQLGHACQRDSEQGCPARKTFGTGTLHKRLHTYLDQDGKTRYIEIHCSPLRDESGEVFQVIEVRRDITERKLIEEQLIHAEKLTSIGRLAANVAHEINNPLDGMQNCLDIIQKHPTDKTTVGIMLELLSEGLDRIGFIVRRLLMFSRYHRLTMENMDLNEVIAQSLVWVVGTIEDQGAELKALLCEETLPILGDPYNLSQVFINILLNASDALEGNGAGQIKIETQLVAEDETHFAEVKIWDNGCGISEEDLAKVFSPFFTTKDAEKGTGLGLSISRNIVEEHGGSITISSYPDQGTTVRVLLPTGGEE